MAYQAPDKPKRKRRTKAEMTSTRQATIKPPTQGVGVIGINDSTFGSDTSGVRWEVLIHLPKFQAFCIEQSGLSYENVMDWIVDFAVSELEKDNCQFFKDYKDWHDAKGYWKNETIYGELIDAQTV